MKFLGDMGISPVTIRRLRSEGHDAVHLQELGLTRLADIDIVAKARAEGRIILTHDLDFGQILAASRDSMLSVIIFRLKDMRPVNLEVYLEHILREYSEALKNGAIISVNERRVRVRTLPIST